MAILAFAALNVLTPSDVFAQNANDGGGTVSGVVTDDQGPVIGAAVMIKDGQGGVTTGFSSPEMSSSCPFSDTKPRKFPM